MNTVATCDIRGRRLYVERDESPEHPLNMTDEPIYVDTYAPFKAFGPSRSEPRVNPLYTGPRSYYYDRQRPIIQSWLYLFFDDDGHECPASRAAGALSLNVQEWTHYAGRAPRLADLRATLAECRDYWQGDVFSFRLMETFKSRGETYERPVSIDSCWGFYGADGIRAMRDYVGGRTFKRFLSRLAARV